MKWTSDLRIRVRAAILTGLVIATTLSVLATMIWLIKGPEAFSRNGLVLWRIVGLYYVGGVVGGAIFGVLLPIAKKSVYGGVLVAFLALMPFFTAVVFSMMPRADWFPPGVVIAAICALVIAAAANAKST